MAVGRGARPPRRAGSAGSQTPLAALLVGDGERLTASLERVGAARLVEVLAVLTPDAALAPAAPAGAALVVAPWPDAAAWLPDAPPGSPLGGGLPILLLGDEPPRARLLVETPGASLPAALDPAAGGPLAGLAGELATLRAENRELREALEARKSIERAKGILMELEGITEAEAFARIQRLSMVRRTSMKTVAEAIILSREASSRSEPR